MRSLIACVAVAAALVPAAAAAAPQPAPNRPLVKLYDAPGITRACDQGIARARATIKQMEARKGAGAIFDEWNRLQIGLEDVVNAIYLLGSVSPDKAVRDAAEPCLQKFTTFQADLFQNEKLFARVSAVQPANPRQAKLKKDLLEGFEDTGVALPTEKRKRAKEIFEKIEELRQAFDRNVRDDPTKVVFKPEDMEGMPEAYLTARKRDADGNYVLGLDYPSYVPFQQNAKREEARKRYYMAKLNEGGAQNLDLLYQIFELRKELAGLYGLPSFADYALRRKMVQSPATVTKFLAEVKAAVTNLETKEVNELRAWKARDVQLPVSGMRIYRWDVPYYAEKVRRERFKVDQEKLRKYFPTDKAVRYTLLVAETLYGVKFNEAKVPVWHPDVRYFDVVDAKTGRFISGFYLDLFPREGKYNHAAAFPIRGVSRLAKRTPLSALVTNFNREGLDHNELETLMHEFGHVLHGVLSQADYNPHAGTSVKGDFVEAPSQMFEEWARREQPLALFKKVCADCPQLTQKEIAQLESARRYGQGIRYSRQWLYAAFDMALSTDPQPPLAVWKTLESATPLGHVEGTSFPSSFSHIANNYAAGYYGYMWSEVIALDMLSPFKANMLDPAVGARYRDTILAQGGQEEEMDLVKRFLGREPSNEAFFQEITGKR
ncbi:MAG: Zn-dependent oligopeptidase [Burkholderiales bacterium]|nr:Zn-dependent oligopeptidase [Burkholderiales bacterium]